MSVNPHDMTVQEDPSLDLAAEGVAQFCNNCKRWAAKAYLVAGGGVSLKLKKEAVVGPSASVWWNGKKVADINFDYDTGCERRPHLPYIAWRGDVQGLENRYVAVDDHTVWEELLKPLLLKLLAEERKRIAKIEDDVNSIDSAKWQKIKLW